MIPTLVIASRRRFYTTSSSSYSKGSSSSSFLVLQKIGYDKDEYTLLLSSSTSNNNNRYHFLRKNIPHRYLPHLNSEQLKNQFIPFQNSFVINPKMVGIYILNLILVRRKYYSNFMGVDLSVIVPN